WTMRSSGSAPCGSPCSGFYGTDINSPGLPFWLLAGSAAVQLTIEAQEQVDASPLFQREIIRRLGTSAAQFYRLLDQTNYRKSVDQLLSLLHVLDCDVDLVVRAKSA
ncbi:helix-turn-helix domain-containing protein, partial [Acidobacteria bacterium AH-259-A15]|nr:helix-turn-helix domain-containing protein [Acidobacteria bacterium AH-259-A15]